MDGGAAQLAAALKDNTGLTTLDLSGACGPTRRRNARTHAREHAPSPPPTPLTRASHSAGNRIGDAGATQLAAALIKDNKTLTTLHLGGACGPT